MFCGDTAESAAKKKPLGKKTTHDHDDVWTQQGRKNMLVSYVDKFHTREKNL